METQNRNASVLCDAGTRKAEAMCPSEIFKRFGDAAVTLRTVPKFRVFWQNFNGYTDCLNPGSHYNAGVVPISTSGFFIQKGFIVSGIPFVTILLLSVLFFTYIAAMCWQPGMTIDTLSAAVNTCCGCTGIPPTSSNLVNNYHELPGFIELMRGICSGSSFADFFTFEVEVFNVNGCGENYGYRAYLVGLDFETGVGVYRIEPSDPFNKCLPLIRKQKFLKFGSSKCYTPGNQVHTVADLRCSGSRSFSSGYVIDNTNLSRQGDVNYELMTTNMDIGRGAEGAPILNDCAYVVGIVTGMTKHGNAIGVTSSFICRVIDAILDVACNVDDSNNQCCNEHALYVDLFGCVLYRYGTINWSFRGKTSLDLNQLFLQRAVSKQPCKVTTVAPTPGAHPFAAANNDGNTCTDWEGLQNRFYNDTTCRINRELIGIIIDCEPCGQLAEVVEECHRASPNWGKGCSDIYQIEKGDIVTHLNGSPLGTLPNQNTPLNILYSLNACDCVELRFRKADELLTQCHALRVRLDDSLCWIDDFRPIALACLQISTADDVTTYLSQAAPLPVTDTISCFATTWLQFIFWLLHAVPQIYRATFFTNLSAFMVKLNALTNQTVYTDNVPAADPTLSLGTALQLSDLSRSVMSVVAEPSIASCYEPASFIDFISSFQHPNNFDCFKTSIPNYLAIYATHTGAFGTLINSQLPAGSPASALYSAVTSLPLVPKQVVDMASQAVFGMQIFPTGTSQM